MKIEDKNYYPLPSSDTFLEKVEPAADEKIRVNDTGSMKIVVGNIQPEREK